MFMPFPRQNPRCYFTFDRGYTYNDHSWDCEVHLVLFFFIKYCPWFSYLIIIDTSNNHSSVPFV